MSSKIKQMSMTEIIKRIGFPSDLKEFESTYRYNVDKEEIEKFKAKVVKLNNTHKKGFEDYMNLINEHEDIFDKEIYFLHITKLLEKDLYLGDEEKPRVFNQKNNDTNTNMASRRQSLYRAARKLLSTIDVVDITTSENEDGEIEYSVSCSQEITSQKSELEEKNLKIQNQLEKIEDMLGLEKVLSFLRPRDIFDICKYKNLGDFLSKLLIEELGEHSERNLSDDIDIPDYTDEDLEKFKEIIVDNAEYIEIDKMLILANAIYFNKHGENFEEFEYEDAIDLKNFTERVDFLLDKKKTILNSKRFEGKIDFKTVKQSVSDLYNHFIDGRFYTEEEINDLAQRMIQGTTSLSILTKEEFLNVMNFSTEERKLLIENNPSAIEYLINNELATSEEIKAPIISGKKTDSRQLFAIYSTGIISEEDIIDLYLDKKIELEELQSLQKQITEEKDFSQIVSSKKLIELFLNQKDGKEEIFDRYRKLYKSIAIDGKDLEEQKRVANEILDYSLDLLEENKIYDLYHMGLLPIDTLVDFIGEKSVTELYSSRELKPVDARRLYDSNIISEEAITEVLKNKNISDSEKLVLIFSTFPNPEDIDIYQRLLSNLSDVAQSIYDKKGNKDTSHKDLKNIKPNNVSTPKIQQEDNRKTTDPCARWKLIAKIDSDYSQEYLKDGHVIFYLPNNGKYIIEKLFTKDLRPAYGAATYILSENEFEKNENVIISKNSKVNRSVLPSLKSQSDDIDKLVHTGWANAIVRYFDLENLEKYTENQIEEFKKIAEQVENSKKPLERE